MEFPSFPAIGSDREVILTFDFTGSLSSDLTLTDIKSVIATVNFGNDDTPQNIIVSSALNGAKVFVAVSSGNVDTDYSIEVICNTSTSLINKTITRILPIRR